MGLEDDDVDKNALKSSYELRACATNPLFSKAAVDGKN